MKTINFFTSHFLPENTACTNRVLSYIKEFEHTYNINVITLTEKGVTKKQKIVQYSKNITIYYLEQKDFNGKNFFKRAFYEAYYINQLINLSKPLKAELTIATTPYMFMIPFIANRVSGSKVIDIRDMVWEYLGDKGIVNKTIKSLLSSIMERSLSKFNSIFVTNDYEYKLVKEKYKRHNVHIISNGISSERYHQLSNIEPKKLNIKTVTYVGNIGLAQNIKVLIDAAEKLPRTNFLIIGDGVELSNLKTYVKNKNLNNITFTGKLPWSELHKYYEQTSILYAQLDGKYISAMPSKLYEYTTIGLPIIYGGKGQAKLFIEKLENAKSISPNNVEELVTAIESFKVESIGISKHNRDLIQQHYLREIAVKNASQYIFSLAKAKKTVLKKSKG